MEQVVRYLLGPFYRQRPLVQLDSSAWMEGRLSDVCSGLGVSIDFVPLLNDPTSSPVGPHLQQTSEGSPSHLQGWTGPALFPVSDLKGSEVDLFLPGLWATLHIICINTFVLHTLQIQGSDRQVHLTEFTRALASQLAVDSSITVPVLPPLDSTSYQETRSSKRRLVLQFVLVFQFELNITSQYWTSEETTNQTATSQTEADVR